MSNIKCYDSSGTLLKTLYQWDINQSVTIKGLTDNETYVFHFCNRLSKEAMVVPPEHVDTDITVKIPNILLQQPESIVMYIYKETPDNGKKTMYAVQIPVIKRLKPDDYEYNENIDYVSVALLDSRLTTILKYLTDSSSDSLSLEIADIRTGYDGTEYPTAGDAVRAVGQALDNFKENEAVNGLRYENNLLYLTANGENVSSPVKIIGEGGGGSSVDIGEGLKWDEKGRITVDVTNSVEEDNTKPITSAAVYATVGNIEAYLKII